MARQGISCFNIFIQKHLLRACHVPGARGTRRQVPVLELILPGRHSQEGGQGQWCRVRLGERPRRSEAQKGACMLTPWGRGSGLLGLGRGLQAEGPASAKALERERRCRGGGGGRAAPRGGRRCKGSRGRKGTLAEAGERRWTSPEPCAPGKQRQFRSALPFCVPGNGLLRTTSLPHRTQIRYTDDPCAPRIGTDTDPPHAHLCLTTDWGNCLSPQN